MLINLSNHPSNIWGKEQLGAAKVYGEIVDIPFPAMDPAGDEEYVKRLCEEYTTKVLAFVEGDSKLFVHLMGEMTLTFALVNALTKKGVTCMASTSTRMVKEVGVDQKEVTFAFVRFRIYE